ncbi:alkaline phosphatase, tissue-nonspecific isozyme-like [Amphiura filiformis]|uniref:alkaline phosphatase, tissue-nonspecific isozyme-like n=1 Tax=Amphiura filiformis TaxID=82378 RepID=UPI003B20C50C
MKMKMILSLPLVLAYIGLSLAQPKDYWYDLAKLSIENAKKLENLNTNVAKNIVFVLGDGMSIATVSAARILKGQQNLEPGEEGYLSWETFPHASLSKTYNTDHQVSDSAGTATAYLSGAKTKRGLIGVDDGGVRGDCASSVGNEIGSILRMARNAGKSVGFVTTARITHATPSALYAHVPERNWEADSDIPASESACRDIALQFLENDDIQVAMGGGRENFMLNTERDPETNRLGKREDGRDLIKEWVAAKSQLGTAKYVWEKSEFDAIDPPNVDYLLGLFSDSHMEYDIHPYFAGAPSLAEMTQKAIQILEKNPNGFFLLVEAGRIDHGHHAGAATLALTDTIAMDAAVTMAKSMTNDQDTLTIVTADHSHTMTFGGYPSRGNPILGLADDYGLPDLGSDNLPYTTLIYANGPGGVQTRLTYRNTGKRPDVTNEDTSSDRYQQQALVPLESETHAGDDVAIWADGPMAHLFHSVHEQHYIMHVMAYAACLDAGAPHCSP